MKSGVGVGGAGRAGCCLPSPSPGPGMLGPQALSRRQEGGRLRWPAVGGGKGPLGSAPAWPHRRRWVERQESPVVGPRPPGTSLPSGYLSLPEVQTQTCLFLWWPPPSPTRMGGPQGAVGVCSLPHPQLLPPPRHAGSEAGRRRRRSAGSSWSDTCKTPPCRGLGTRQH